MLRNYEFVNVELLRFIKVRYFCSKFFFFFKREVPLRFRRPGLSLLLEKTSFLKINKMVDYFSRVWLVPVFTSKLPFVLRRIRTISSSCFDTGYVVLGGLMLHTPPPPPPPLTLVYHRKIFSLLNSMFHYCPFGFVKLSGGIPGGVSTQCVTDVGKCYH